MKYFFDVVIVGAGVVGCAIARELAQYDLSVAVLEKESDVASGASGRNSGVVHAGFNNPVGSLKAKFCVEGNALFGEICRLLSVPFRKTAKLVVALNREDLQILENLQKTGEANGVPDLHIIGKNEIERMEPHVAGIAALYSGSTAVTSPFLFTVALAENAWRNGVKFFFDSEVVSIRWDGKSFKTKAGNDLFVSDCLINSAGINADRVAKMAGEKEFKLFPCRGQYHVLDKKTSAWLKMPVYPVPRPGASGLGVHLTPTVDGNILVGPSAEYVGYRFDHATTREIMNRLTIEARQLWPVYSPKYIIRSYSGIRAKTTGPKESGSGDFIICEAPKIPGLINLVGIESPGLTSAVPIARKVTGIVDERFKLSRKPSFEARRKKEPRFSEITPAERERAIEECPDFGEIICRCEQVSRKEVLEAVNNPLGVTSLTGIKYRARCMMGRCQGGYCLTRIIEVLLKEKGLRIDEITVRNPHSKLFLGNVK